MADFNVKVRNAENSSGLVGQSRGATAPKAREVVARPSSVIDTSAATSAMSGVVGGLGNLFSATVDVADSLIKRDINDIATRETDSVFNEFGVNDAMINERNAGDNVPPEEISRAEANLKRLHNARVRGAVSDTAYAGRMESVARQLRARYPGHRDYIDDRIASIAGGRPANMVMRELNAQADAARSAASAGEKDRLQLLESVTKAGFYKPGYENLSHTELIQQTGPLFAQKQKIDLIKSEIELKKSANEALGDEARRGATQVVNLQLTDMLTNVTSPFGKTYNEIITRLKSESANGAPLSVDDQNIIRAQVGQLRRDFLLKAQEGIVANFGADLTKEQRDEVLAPALQMLTTLEESLVNKDFGSLNRMVNKLEASKIDDSIKLLDSGPELRAISAMNREFGPQATAILIDTNDTLKNAYLRTIVNGSITNLFGGGSNVKAEHAELERRGVTDPAAYRAVLDAPLTILNNPTATPKQVQLAAKALYSPETGGYLAKITSEERHLIFSRMVNDNVYQSIKASGDVETQENYKAWARSSFASLFRNKAQSIRELTDRTDVSFNPETVQFEVRDTFDSRYGFDESMIPNDEASRQARKVASELNVVLRGMAPIIKDGKQDPSEFMNTVLGGLGAKKIAPLPGRMNLLRGNQQGASTVDNERAQFDQARDLSNRMEAERGIITELRELYSLRRQNPNDLSLDDEIEQRLVDLEKLTNENWNNALDVSKEKDVLQRQQREDQVQELLRSTDNPHKGLSDTDFQDILKNAEDVLKQEGQRLDNVRKLLDQNAKPRNN